ncbi:CRTAC1 family protein [Chloroflexi bacterium TSY]|nr:CRTAC1 family protein [Chloroflexi bacterium TSY]
MQISDWSFGHNDPNLYENISLDNITSGEYVLLFAQAEGVGFFEYTLSHGGGRMSNVAALAIGGLLAISFVLGLTLLLLVATRFSLLWRVSLWTLLVSSTLVGCIPPDQRLMNQTGIPNELPQPAPSESAIVVSTQELTPSSLSCQGKFIPHLLDHTTTIDADIVRQYESNGAGLAINDLDNDGDLDIVFANLDGPNRLLWNEGDLRFHPALLGHPDTSGDSRDVDIVDVNGDGWFDIVLTRRHRKPMEFWLNQGETALRNFVLSDEYNVRHAYTASWADLDGDADLDLVTAEYDIELTDGRKPDVINVGGGVLYYENRDGSFIPSSVALHSQALALLLTDLNEDGQTDILVGNDFDSPDQVWYGSDQGWQEATPFRTITHNTMSFAVGDLDNDGHDEIFATDMMPYAHDEETMAAWEPVMSIMSDPPASDPQTMANVLQVRDERGRFADRAPISGLTATGWSWSAKFGDLDNDGFLDLYVVNGMMAVELFRHLPNNELVEENQAFRNIGQGQFVPAGEWNLNTTGSGRSMSMADLDDDGDLDIVVNNLQSPAQLLENQLCGGRALEIDLFWPDSPNQRAIGSRLTLHTSTGTYYRTTHSDSGYLSGDPARVHFGFPIETRLEKLVIRWPDGMNTIVDTPESQTLMKVIRE